MARLKDAMPGHGTFDDGAQDFMLGEGVSDDEVNAALAAFVVAQLEGGSGQG